MLPGLGVLQEPSKRTEDEWDSLHPRLKSCFNVYMTLSLDFLSNDESSLLLKIKDMPKLVPPCIHLSPSPYLWHNNTDLSPPPVDVSQNLFSDLSMADVIALFDENEAELLCIN